MPLPATSETLGAGVAMVAAGAAAVVDVRTGRIPNALTASAAATGLTLALFGVGSDGIAAALAGGALGLALMLPGHLLGGTGAGDVKLMGALGTLLGPAGAVTAFLASAIAGGVLAVGHAWRRRRLGATLARTARLATAPVAAKAAIDADAPRTRFAYGPALAIGAIVAVLWR